MINPSTFISRANEDQFIKNIQQHVINLNRILGLSKHLTTVREYHKNIPSTKLIVRGSLTASSQKVAETAALIQEQRSNILDIKLFLFIESAKLTEYIESIRNHLTYNYYGAIMSDYKVRDHQKGVVEFVLQIPNNLLNRINTLISYIDLVIADLDKAGFTITNITKALEQVSKDRLI